MFITFYISLSHYWIKIFGNNMILNNENNENNEKKVMKTRIYGTSVGAPFGKVEYL